MAYALSIAVIIPVYNVTAFLAEAIRSALAQDYPHTEIWVIDDGSTPPAAGEITRICEAFPTVRLRRKAHEGVAIARQFGLSQTNAEYIVYLDADDVMAHNALGAFATAMQARPDAAGVYGRVQRMNAQGEHVGTPTPELPGMEAGEPLLRRLLANRASFCVGAVCARRTALLEIRPNNEGLVYAEDWVMWCHLALSGFLFPLPEAERVVLYRRQHADNVSSRVTDDPAPLFAAYERVFGNPLFIQAMGAEQLGKLQRECLSKFHAFLARHYAISGQPEKAKQHFDRIDLPLGEFLKKKEMPE